MSKPLAPWTKAFPEQARKLRGPVKEKHRIRSISPRQRERLRKYAKVRKEFLAKKIYCAVCSECRTLFQSLEPHHSRGRNGKLLCDVRFLFAVHPSCHRWIHDHPDEARARGLLCAKGDWGKQEP